MQYDATALSQQGLLGAHHERDGGPDGRGAAAQERALRAVQAPRARAQRPGECARQRPQVGLPQYQKPGQAAHARTR